VNPDDSPRWPLHLVVWCLLPLAIVGAGVLSATATLALARDAGVSPAVSPFLVFMVEVVSLAATLLAIFSTVSKLRIRAMVLVVGATLVALVAGWRHYGGVGLLAGVFLVFLIHLASEAWLELRDRKRQDVEAEAARADTELIPVARAEATPNPTPTVALTVRKPEPQPESPATVPSALDDFDALTVYRAQALLAENPKVGRPRLKAELGVTDHAAKRLLAALRPVRPVEEESA
jgi:hypothetical protein